MHPSDELIKAIEAADKAVRANQSINQIYGVRDGLPPIAPWPKEPCKIIFLDFDGVINSELSTRKLGTKYRLAKENVAALNEILLKTGARFVVTSSWREALVLTEIVRFLERDGVLSGRVAGQTRFLQTARGLEIDEWLSAVPYTVSSFVILDDRDDMDPHRKRLVQVNPQIGLGMQQAQHAVELLAVPWAGKKP